MFEALAATAEDKKHHDHRRLLPLVQYSVILTIFISSTQ